MIAEVMINGLLVLGFVISGIAQSACTKVNGYFYQIVLEAYTISLYNNLQSLTAQNPNGR